MDVWDAWDIYIGVLLAIAAIFFVVSLFKTGKAKKLVAEGDEALSSGDDARAIALYREALSSANEKPQMELHIVAQLKSIYARNAVEFDFTDFETLIAQGKDLARRSSNKSTRDYLATQNLKEKIVAKMPDLA
jgi:hypothetical protein